MDRLDTMRTYVRVAELGSLAAVARQMNVDRSLVTRQLADLEAHLGVQLIARSTRSLRLTSAGSAYLESCREILVLVDAAENGLGDDGRQPRGLIRLSVPLSFGLRHLSPLLTEFSATYPEVLCEIDFTERRVKLVEEGFDLAIRIARRLEPLDVSRRIGSSRLTVLASPDYLRRRGEPRHPGDLAAHECLLYLPGQRGGWSFEVDGKTLLFPVSGRLRANNGEVLLDAAVRGLGIVAQPTFLCAAAVQAGAVRPILGDYPMPELGIYALLASHRYVLTCPGIFGPVET
ncbi:MAG TPA: LysR family transcriptional regulator [Accumulibacter sp.]|nr:LysR family transcriptional regulator [Accumulibacter sp.]